VSCASCAVMAVDLLSSWTAAMASANRRAFMEALLALVVILREPFGFAQGRLRE